MKRRAGFTLLAQAVAALFGVSSLGSSCDAPDVHPPFVGDNPSIPVHCVVTANICPPGAVDASGACQVPLTNGTFDDETICVPSGEDPTADCKKLCARCSLPSCDPKTCAGTQSNAPGNPVGCSGSGNVFGGGGGGAGGTGGTGGSGGSAAGPTNFAIISVAFTATDIEQLNNTATLTPTQPFPLPTQNGTPTSINADQGADNIWLAAANNAPQGSPSNDSIQAIAVGTPDSIPVTMPPPAQASGLTSIHVGEQIVLTPPRATVVATSAGGIAMMIASSGGPTQVQFRSLMGAEDADLSSTFTMQPDVATIGTARAAYLSGFNFPVNGGISLDPLEPVGVAIGTNRFWVLSKDPTNGDQAVLSQYFANNNPQQGVTVNFGTGLSGNPVKPTKIDGGSGADDGSAPGAVVVAALRDPGVGELRLFTGGNVKDPTEPNTRITLGGEPRALKVFELSSPGPNPDAGNQNQDAGNVDLRQYAWVLEQDGGTLFMRCYNLSTRQSVADVNLGSYCGLDLAVGIRNSLPPIQNKVLQAGSTAFVHALVGNVCPAD